MLTMVSLAYWTFFLVSLPIGFLIGFVVWLLTLPFDRRADLVHLYTCYWGRFYIACCPIWTLRVVGRSKIPRGAVVFVSNHESLIDILVLFGLQWPFKWVSKESNFRLPFIGWIMRLCRYIPLVRGDRDSIVKMMETSRFWLGQGVPVMIFPEGTRSKTGKLQPFKDGAFLLAKETGAPIVPIAMTGTGRTLPKHGLILKDRMDAVVQVLDPIDPHSYATVEELREATRATIAGTLEREKVVA